MRGRSVVSPLTVVVTWYPEFWISIEEFLEQSSKVLAHSLFDFLKVVPWRPRGSVVEFL